MLRRWAPVWAKAKVSFFYCYLESPEHDDVKLLAVLRFKQLDLARPERSKKDMTGVDLSGVRADLLIIDHGQLNLANWPTQVRALHFQGDTDSVHWYLREDKTELPCLPELRELSVSFKRLNGDRHDPALDEKLRSKLARDFTRMPPALKKLSLHGCRLGAASLELVLRALTALEELCLTEDARRGHDLSSYDLKDCPSLRKLRLRALRLQGFPHINFDVLQHVNREHLRLLHLDYCLRGEEPGDVTLLGDAPQLRQLRARDPRCESLLAHFPTGLKLRVLALEKLWSGTEVGLQVLAALRLNNLQLLSLIARDNDVIAGWQQPELLLQLPKLQTLLLDHQVTSEETWSTLTSWLQRNLHPRLTSAGLVDEFREQVCDSYLERSASQLLGD